MLQLRCQIHARSPLSTPQFLCLMAEKDTNENDFPSTSPPDDPATSPPPPENHEPVELPKISFHALTGQLVPTILKLANKLHWHLVTVLIDGGSISNFIHAKLASHLGLTIHSSHHLRVTMGNDDIMDCAGICLQVSLLLEKSLFNVNLFLLPIYGADVVLGV